MMSSHYVSQSIWPHGGVAKKLNDRMGEAGKSSYVNNSLVDCLTVFRCFVSARNQKISRGWERVCPGSSSWNFVLKFFRCVARGGKKPDTCFVFIIVERTKKVTSKR